MGIEGTRAKATAKLQAALGGNNADAARNLELCVFNYVVRRAAQLQVPRYWENARFRSMYTHKVLSMAFNLTDPANPGLRARVLDPASADKVSLKRLVSMSHEQMFPELYAPLLQQLADKHLAKTCDLPLDYKGAFQCGQCKSWRTNYIQLQTRAADEPATNYVNCVNCGKRWKC